MSLFAYFSYETVYSKMRQHTRRLQNRTLKEINGCQPKTELKTLLAVSCLKLNGMSTVQQKQQLEKQETSKVLLATLIEYSTSRRIIRPFIPLLMSSSALQRLVSRKLHFKMENTTFPRAIVQKTTSRFLANFGPGKPFLVWEKAGPAKSAGVISQSDSRT